MKFLLFILIPLISFSNDRDKYLHYGAGLGISIVTGKIVYEITDNNALSLSTGIFFGGLSGYGKEHYDRGIRKTYFSNEDALTTMWGALNGAIILRVHIDIKEKKHRKKHPELYEY